MCTSGTLHLPKLGFDRNFWSVAIFDTKIIISSLAHLANNDSDQSDAYRGSYFQLKYDLSEQYYFFSKIACTKFQKRHSRKTSFLDMSPIFWRYEKNKDTLRRSNLAKESVHGLHFDHGHTYIPILETFCPWTTKFSLKCVIFTRKMCCR